MNTTNPTDSSLLDDNTRLGLLDLDDDAPLAPLVPQTPAPPPAVPAPRQTSLPLENGAHIAPAIPASRLAPAVVTAPARPAIVRDQLIAVESADQSTGAVAYWQLSGDVTETALRTAWDEHLPGRSHLLPDSSSPAVALTRAAKELQDRGTLVRKHPKGGYAVVVERVVNGELTYAQRCRVYLVQTTQNENVLSFDFGAETVDADLCTRVRVAYEHALHSLTTVDVSQWLVWLAAKLDGVPLRERGGIYFIPKHQVETLRAVKRALAAAGTGHRIHEIPALKSSEAIEAIVAAVSDEAGAFVTATRAELTDMGARMAGNRIKELDALKAKMSSYAKLLGVAIVTADLDALRVELAKATTRTAQLEV